VHIIVSPCSSPVAVLALLGHACERRLQAAQVVVELTGVTQQQQVLVLVLLTYPTTVVGEIHISVNMVIAIFSPAFYTPTFKKKR